MPTTRAETTHTSRPVQRGYSLMRGMRSKARSHKEKLPLIKIGAMMIAIAIMMIVYVRYVNEASTYGYFYKVETQKLEQTLFEYNLVKLDVLTRQQQLWNQATNFDAWSDPAALRDRLVIIDLSESSDPLHSEEQPQ